MLKSDKPRVKEGQSTKIRYLSMMTVTTLGSLNTEFFCECVESSVKLVVSDLHVTLKPSEIRMLVMFRMNCGFMEYYDSGMDLSITIDKLRVFINNTLKRKVKDTGRSR